ncbi:hypothetical protein ACFU76_27535 [Streptomyces sp. NPDC057539]|uniref:hypothetical protein n=1 Tax=Streptomyces sp. NPDC057539 TaxID=3346159 RepID=UPI0036A8362A
MKKKNQTAPQASACVEGPMRPGYPLPTMPTILVVIVLALFTALTVSGMPVETVAVTLGAGGLLGIELVRRLIQSLPRRRSL